MSFIKIFPPKKKTDKNNKNKPKYKPQKQYTDEEKVIYYTKRAKDNSLSKHQRIHAQEFIDCASMGGVQYECVLQSAADIAGGNPVE